MFCKNCGQQIADNATLCNHCGTPVLQAQSYAPPPVQPTAQPVNIPNHLVGAILTTLCCCQICGIVSIVYAAQVNGKIARGDIAGAQRSSKNAATWMWIGVAIGGVINILALVLNFGAIAAGIAAEQ